MIVVTLKFRGKLKRTHYTASDAVPPQKVK